MAAIFLERDKEKFSGQAGSCCIRNHRRKHYQLLDDSSDVGSKHGGMNLMTHWDFLFFSSCICESLIVRKNASGIINTSTSLLHWMNKMFSWSILLLQFKKKSFFLYLLPKLCNASAKNRKFRATRIVVKCCFALQKGLLFFRSSKSWQTMTKKERASISAIG